jgi:protease-4
MNKWTFAIGFLIVLFIVSIIAAALINGFQDTGLSYGNVAVIPIEGVIMTGESGSILDDNAASSTQIVKYLEEAAKDDSIKAIVLEINSPGGSPVASDEIALAVKKTNKTTIALIRDVGASGAYWVASSANIIVANRMSVTGSIGVIGSYLDFSGFLQRYNVSYERLVSGKYKDAGTPYRALTPEEEKMFQQNLDEIREFFIQEVAKNRNMSINKTRQLATGMWFLGSKAKELGLVDVLGNKDTVDEILKKKLNETPVYVRYEHKKTLFDYFSASLSKQSYNLGLGIGQSIVETSSKETAIKV